MASYTQTATGKEQLVDYWLALGFRTPMQRIGEVISLMQVVKHVSLVIEMFSTQSGSRDRLNFRSEPVKTLRKS